MKSLYLILTIAVLAIFITPHETVAQTVNLISPEDGAQVTVKASGRVSFNFQLPGYEVDYYAIQVAIDPDFAVPNLVAYDSFIHSEYKSFDLERRVKYYWRVRAYYRPNPSSGYIYSNWSVTNDFIVIVPDLLSPIDGAVNLIQPIVLEWLPIIEGLIIGAGHQLWVDDNSDFSSPEIDIKTNGSQRTVSGLDLDTKYYWKVRYYARTVTPPIYTRYYEWSVTREFTICDVPDTPVLISPSSSATVAQPVIIIWTTTWSTYGKADEFNLQITTIPGFSSNVVDEVVAPSVYPTTSYSASGLEDNTTYYWRVRAGNECGWSNFSLDRAFITDCPVPDPPTLELPADGVILDISQPYFWNWSEVIGATKFHIQIDNTNSDFNSLVVDVSDITTVSHFAWDGLMDETHYYWRVRSGNDCGWGDWSDPSDFITECPIPDPPILELPADGATDVSQPVTWDWNDVPGATKYHIQIDDNSNFSSVVVDNSNRVSSDFTWD